jgi:predicted metal-dependent hydrolase
MPGHRQGEVRGVSTGPDHVSRDLEIEYGQHRIPISVTFRPGTRLSISVHPDRQVTAVAPIGRSLEQVMQRLRARGGWILRQRREFEKYIPHPSPRRYVSGETHLYLGRQYRLRIRPAADESVAMKGGLIVVETTKPDDHQNVRERIGRWYRSHAREVLERRFSVCMGKMRSAGLQPLTPVLRQMTRRWGSCTKSGHVLLNPDLVKVPVQCIDYVIIHELCHLKVLRHDKRFYSLLGRYLPDWEKRKKRLDEFVLPLDR